MTGLSSNAASTPRRRVSSRRLPIRQPRARWFKGPTDWGVSRFESDFRVGGKEVNSGGPKGGPVHSFEATYYDIVHDERIIFVYEMELDGKRISVSLTTVELAPEAAGTRMRFTEQDVFLDGWDNVDSREEGTRELLDAL